MTLVDYTVISFVGYTICEKGNNLQDARTVLVSLSIVNGKIDRKKK